MRIKCLAKGHNRYNLSCGTNIDETSFTIATKVGVMNCNSFFGQTLVLPCHLNPPKN
jgi:hypothetical protein